MNKSGLFFYMQYGLVEVGDKNICLKSRNLFLRQPFFVVRGFCEDRNRTVVL